MTGSALRALPRFPIRRVFHPTDFSLASEQAFVHALKVALAARAELSILHVGSKGAAAHWRDFPGVHQTLERWGVLPANSSRDDVARTGLRVSKTFVDGGRPAEAVLRRLEREPAELVVLATERHEGFSRLVHRQVAKPIARLSGAMTLLVPEGSRGIVDGKDGSTHLRRLLVPVCRDPRPQPALAAAAAVSHALGAGAVEAKLLHVGHEATAPVVREVFDSAWTWSEELRPGQVVEQVQAFAERWDPDLVSLTTKGHDDFLDFFRGSTTERILDSLRCPVLAIPASSRTLPAVYLT